MPDDRFSPASLPRPLRIAALSLAGLLLFAFFVYLGFPYDLLAARLSSRIEQATGMRLSYGPVRASPQLLGPGIAVDGLRARTPGGESWEFGRLALRPAWSLSWLRGEAAIHLDGDASFGRVRGVARVSEEPGFDGELVGVDLAILLRTAAVQAGLSGTADVEADLRFPADGAEGPLTLVARDGVISHPSLPLDVPYQQIDGRLVFGGETLLEIQSCEIRSPMGTGTIQGTIARGRDLQTAPVDLQLRIVAAENMRSVLRGQGVRLGQDGEVEMSVRGTLARPIVR